MQRNRKAEQSRVEKEKANDTQKRFAIFVIDLGARRDERRQNTRINNEIQNGEITPVGGEKGLHDGIRRSQAPLQNQRSTG